MKKVILFLSIAVFAFTNLSAQCSIITTSIDSDIGYVANYESIYRNEDLENGLQGVHFRLLALENGQDKELLKFGCYVMVSSKRPKKPLVPRKIRFIMEDNKTIDIEAEKFEPVSLKAGVTSNQCYFTISSNTFISLMTKKTKSIIITDTRQGTSITARPYSGLVQEQAMCIGKSIGLNK